MRGYLRYRHPVTGNCYYYRKMMVSDGGGLRPVGCMRHRTHLAMEFPRKRDSSLVKRQLESLGYQNVRFVPIS